MRSSARMSKLRARSLRRCATPAQSRKRRAANARRRWWRCPSRARNARLAEYEAPMISNESVKARTGKDWETWFGLLDRAGAPKLGHPAMAEWLVKKHGVPGWWAQNVTVEYERARGLRERHQTGAGYKVAVTKTIASAL